MAAVRFKDENTTFAGLNQEDIENAFKQVIAKPDYEYLDESVTDRLDRDEAGEGGTYA